jgi:3-hydroxyacyl-[acyl-carrier-protein] dehydratase
LRINSIKILPLSRGGKEGLNNMQLDFEQIKNLIPQRFPFIMIDKVLEVEPGKEVLAVKNVSGNDIFFLCHFPDIAIMPGVAIIEAMAQTAIIMFAVKQNENNPPSPSFSKPIYFLGSVKARFFHPVVPGDQLKIKAVNVKSLPTGAYVSAEAFVEDKKVSEAELVFSVKNE